MKHQEREEMFKYAVGLMAFVTVAAAGVVIRTKLPSRVIARSSAEIDEIYAAGL